jgi:hypothetical protein
LNWWYWLWLGVLVAGQALLLLLPIHIAERRLPARRPLKLPILVTGFFLANLVFAGLVAIFCAIFKEEGFGIFGFLTPFKADEVSPSDVQVVAGMIITLLVFWFIWAIVFRDFAKSDEAGSRLKLATHWLLCGNILELLIAVPSHIPDRRRGDCCAPLGTFWGIVTGISVMLLCFGPGVFLSVRRAVWPVETKIAGWHPAKMTGTLSGTQKIDRLPLPVSNRKIESKRSEHFHKSCSGRLPAVVQWRGASGLRRFIGAVRPRAKAALKTPQSKRFASCCIICKSVPRLAPGAAGTDMVHKIPRRF